MKTWNAAIWILAGLSALWADAGNAADVGPGRAVVHSALGGFILGYDIDPDGTEGLLSEALTLPGGGYDIAVETFDQRTGAIVKVVRQQSATDNAYATLGIFSGHVGLVEFEHTRGLYVDRRLYSTLSPLGANRITGRWTPPFSAAADIITSAAASQGSAESAFLGFKNSVSDFSSYVFGSNVGANTFGPLIQVTDPVFDANNSPVMAYDSGANQAVLGGSYGCYGCPTRIGLVDLATGTQSSFTGLGIGFVNGIAVDSETHIACTTSEIDFSVEFYDLVAGTGKIVVLPGATNQAQSGGAVAVDPINKLFLVGQEFSSTAFTGSSIHVFDENGNYIESLNGFRLPASPAYMALNPGQRTGYVIVTPALTSLQSFRY
ncbi:MAG: hypothetical protein JSR59_03940 [Proteobacteria bacterium]|nr:hypothetical protein [Pseudomonadota bacterium]